VKTLVLWFTGLSGSGKTTIADRTIAALRGAGKEVLLLDGDTIRTSLHVELSFSPDDIRENNRRIVALCTDNLGKYDYVFVTIISPFIESRDYARSTLQPNFVEVYIEAGLDECARRDVKGLYRQASQGLIANFIGVSPETPYEPPRAADLVINTERAGIQESTNRLLGFLKTLAQHGE
jgi:adenylylsulfate kinase